MDELDIRKDELDEQEKQEKTLLEKVAQLVLANTPKITEEFSFGSAGVQLLSNGAFFYLKDGVRIEHAHSKAKSADGRKINTRSAKNKGTKQQDITDELGEGKKITTLFTENGLELRREITLRKDGEISIQLFLHDKENKITKTRYLAPFDAPYPDASGKPLFLSLDQKMLLVPYDNDMWARYESAVPRPGRTSYDVTAIYDERTFEGLVVGAVDFTVWKNAIAWAAHDARAYTAFSGVADAATHDILPHGIVEGEWVSSARFVVFWSENIKQGMEHFADLCAMVRPARKWSGKVPFGWNSYSALAMSLQLSHWEEAGKFFREEIPNFCDDEGVSYINLDGTFGKSRKEIRRIVAELHAKGQKAGWYAAPCNAISVMGMLPIPGTLTPLKKIILKDYRGEQLPPADNSIPLDVTHPLWEKHARAMIKNLIDLDFDYIKFDFLSHGSVEGDHYLKGYTGRMALEHAYSIIEDELSKAKKEIFVSLSIAPLFPYYIGNARRCCCDSFGHIEDVRYVLNALNFAWWTNGRIYKYNDPDHLALYHSQVDGRGPTTEAEARSRYTAGVISGTLMILSDNYGPEGDSSIIKNARERTKLIANNAKVNEIARIGKAFVPVEICDGTTPYYTLEHEGKYYAAVFNFEPERRKLSFKAERGGLPVNGIAKDLWREECFDYESELSVEIDAWDCVLLEVEAK